MTSKEAADARLRQRKAKSQMEEAERDIARIEASCSHEWSQVHKEERITSHAYHVDEVRMGSDYIPAYDAPERRRTEWSRTCIHCGKAEVTEHSKPQVTTIESPVW